MVTYIRNVSEIKEIWGNMDNEYLHRPKLAKLLVDSENFEADKEPKLLYQKFK